MLRSFYHDKSVGMICSSILGFFVPFAKKSTTYVFEGRAETFHLKLPLPVVDTKFDIKGFKLCELAAR